MRKDNQQMIDEYYNSIKEQFPGLSREECAACVNAPFIYARKNIESGELPIIRFIHLGTLVVYPKRAVALLAKLTTQFKELKIEAKVYFDKKAMLEKFINKHSESL